MEQLFIIIGILQKNILHIPFFSQAAFLGIIIIIYRKYVDQIPIEPFDNFKPRNYAFIGLIIFTQFLAFAGLIAEGFSFGSVLKKFIIALIMIANFLIIYLVMNMLTREQYQVQKLLAGVFWAFAILIVICLIQIIYVFANGRLESLVELIGRYLEYHNILNPGSFEKISYAQSTQRVNGLYAESGFLAGILAVCFGPFILSAIKNKVNIFFPDKKYNYLMYYGMLVALILVLILAKTSTGILAVGILLLLLLFSVKGKDRLILVGLYFFGGVILSIVVLKIPMLHDMLLSFTVGKTDSDSTTMRLLATQAVLITLFKNPIVGVGVGQTSYFNFMNAPAAVKKLNEYQLFLKNKEFPDQSAWGALLAQFGLVIGIIILIFVVQMLIDMYRNSKNLMAKKVSDYKLDTAITDSAIFYVIIFFILGMLSIQWSYDLYIIIFFFFVNYRNYQNRQLKMESVN